MTELEPPDNTNELRKGLVCSTPKKLANFFLFLVITVVVVGTLANVVIYHVVADPKGNFADVMRRFDLGHEPSIPNFYSAVAILLAAALLVLIGHLERLEKRPDWHYWNFCGFVFFCLAIDEAVLFHEMANAAIGLFFESSGILFLPWVIAGAIFAVLFAIVFIPFVARKSKRTLKLFLLAGGIFLLGAIGLEMVASLIFEQAGSEEAGVATMAHTIAQSIEEFCEMVGIVIFLYALADYLATHYPTIEVRLRETDRHEMAGESK